jgi:hypothetical protein
MPAADRTWPAATPTEIRVRLLFQVNNASVRPSTVVLLRTQAVNCSPKVSSADTSAIFFPPRLSANISRITLRGCAKTSAKSHTREQISCFGSDGLLRQHDYTVDILQGGTGLNYATDYQDVDGIIVPAKRRIYAYEGDYQLVKEPLLVAIDFTDIKLA